jgi:L-alanine-DL-glutamate epimerase-like enolase superfamily enzyme
VVSYLKIIDVRTIVAKVPVSIKIGAMPKFAATGTFVRINTNEGIEGTALTHFSFSDIALSTYIESALKPMLLGRDPFEVEEIAKAIYDCTNRIMFGIPQATSVVEVALWDLIGKSLGKPIYKLLGGHKEKVRAYASFLFWMSPKQLANTAKIAIDQGFKAVKIRIGKSLKDDEDCIKAVREVSPDLKIMADANSAYCNVKDALRLGDICTKYDVEWLEEPLPSDDLYSLSELRSRSAVSIAGGENDFGVHRFREVLDKRAYDIIQPDVTRSGGCIAVRKIGGMAESVSVKCVPHIFGFGLIVAANLQMIGALNNCDWMESPFYPREFYLIKQVIAPDKEGFVEIPQNPGLGVDADWDEINKYKVR